MLFVLQLVYNAVCSCAFSWCRLFLAFQFRVEASDNRQPPGTSQALVTVNILRNQYAPVFSKAQDNLTISEYELVSKFIYRVSATDGDSSSVSLYLTKCLALGFFQKTVILSWLCMVEISGTHDCVFHHILKDVNAGLSDWYKDKLLKHFINLWTLFTHASDISKVFTILHINDALFTLQA